MMLIEDKENINYPLTIKEKMLKYYATGGESVTMVQRFLDNDDIEQILRYYEAKGVKGRNSRKRLVLHRQKEFEITWDNSKPESHPYYEKKDL